MPDYNEVRKALAIKNAMERIDRSLVELACRSRIDKAYGELLSWPAIGDLNHVAAQLEGVVSFWSRGRELSDG